MKIKINQLDGLTYYYSNDDIGIYRGEVNSFKEVHDIMYKRYIERMKQKQQSQ